MTDELFAEAESDPAIGLANLEPGLMRLSRRFDKLSNENRGLKERLGKLEPRFG
ncbi:MAG TPA: hypothetical protein VFY10_10425 [Dehalococcoidia bacterium]|nr:hypothetical protein [Dehalococcoidia bacterium]